MLQLGKMKDGITIALALIFIPIGLYQYLEFRASERIQSALTILERREKSEILNSDIEVRQFWQEFYANNKAPQNEAEYSAFLDLATERILKDAIYRENAARLSTYYNSVAGCAIGKVCDRAVLCSSMAGDVQNFLSKNEHYFAHLWSKSPVDSKRHFLSLPEFVELCTGEDYLGESVWRNSLWPKSDVYTFAVHDHSIDCQISLWLERMFSLGISWACNPEETAYDVRIKSPTQ